MRIVVIIAIGFLAFTLQAQDLEQGVLTLPVNSFDFGRISEDGGKVKHRFEIKNTGLSPLQIIKVRTTCGCTSPSWTQNPIAPGENGFLEVEFDPSERSGDFHKTIQIKSTARNANMFVSVAGKVIPALAREELAYSIGELALKADQVNLGYLYKGKMGQEYLIVRNMSDEAMQIDFDNVPEHIVLDAFPRVLDPGEYGQIEVKFCTEMTDEWDIVLDKVTLVLNNKPVEHEELTVIANVREDFRGMTAEQRMVAPVAIFEHENMVLDTISADEPQKCRFQLKNIGKTELRIRTVKASCGCTVAAPEKNVLAPGEATFIDAVFDPTGRTGNFKNGITVVTNDPAHYKKYLFVEGYIRN